MLIEELAIYTKFQGMLTKKLGNIKTVVAGLGGMEW